MMSSSGNGQIVLREVHHYWFLNKHSCLWMMANDESRNESNFHQASMQGATSLWYCHRNITTWYSCDSLFKVIDASEEIDRKFVLKLSTSSRLGIIPGNPEHVVVWESVLTNREMLGSSKTCKVVPYPSSSGLAFQCIKVTSKIHQQHPTSDQIMCSEWGTIEVHVGFVCVGSWAR